MKRTISRQVHEVTDPVPMKSRVAFKKPLSAHERVLRALRHHQAISRLESEPGDDSFDDPPYEDLTPHQLIVDPDTGQEMTAGEHVMLQSERAQARHDVQHAYEARRRAAARKPKKKIEPQVEETETTDSEESE